MTGKIRAAVTRHAGRDDVCDVSIRPGADRRRRDVPGVDIPRKTHFMREVLAALARGPGDRRPGESGPISFRVAVEAERDVPGEVRAALDILGCFFGAKVRRRTGLREPDEQIAHAEPHESAERGDDAQTPLHALVH